MLLYLSLRTTLQSKKHYQSHFIRITWGTERLGCLSPTTGLSALPGRLSPEPMLSCLLVAPDVGLNHGNRGWKERNHWQDYFNVRFGDCFYLGLKGKKEKFRRLWFFQPGWLGNGWSHKWHQLIICSTTHVTSTRQMYFLNPDLPLT